MERLSKILAQAGVASRRKAEELILEGRVKVNGETIKVLGSKVKQSDLITVDNEPIAKQTLYYYLLNKPTGYLSTVSDDLKRKTVMDLFLPEDKMVRLFPIHKLEFDMSGVLIMTNDGELTKKLTLSNSGIKKEYVVRLSGIMIKDTLRKIRTGIVVDGYKFTPDAIAISELDKKNQSTLVKLIIGDESNKQLRRLFEVVGHKVKNITRIRFDFLTLEGVERGAYRSLKAHEVKRLYREEK